MYTALRKDKTGVWQVTYPGCGCCGGEEELRPEVAKQWLKELEGLVARVKIAIQELERPV